MTSDVFELTKKFGTQAMSEELFELYNAVLSTPEGAVVEVGSASGGTTIALIKAAEVVNKHVYSIDPYPVEYEGVVDHYNVGLMTKLKNDFKNNILNGQYSNITQYNMYSSEAVSLLPDGLSVVFIDGLHELESAQNEINLLLPLMTRGGWMYMHDVTTWEFGQKSRTRETGLKMLLTTINKSMFAETKIVGSMFAGRKW